jgi:hypothetical protein
MGARAIQGRLPCVGRMLRSFEGSMFETFEGFLQLPWHGDLHGVVIVILCNVHIQL